MSVELRERECECDPIVVVCTVMRYVEGRQVEGRTWTKVGGGKWLDSLGLQLPPGLLMAANTMRRGLLAAQGGQV